MDPGRGGGGRGKRQGKQQQKRRGLTGGCKDNMGTCILHGGGGLS